MVSFGNPVQGRIGPPGHPDPSSRFVVTSPFGPRGDGFHDGLDIDNGGESGDPILAMRAGRVYQSFRDDASGGAEIIRIDHGDGWTTGYAHLSRRLVSVNAQVSEGQKIGELGMTGWATGPHVHMDTSYQNERRDPWPLLRQNQEEEDRMKWLDQAKPYTALAELKAGQPLRTSPELSSGNIGTTLEYDYTAETAVVVKGTEYVGSDDWYAYPLNSGGWYCFAKAQATKLTPIEYEDALDEPAPEPPDPCASAARERTTQFAILALLVLAMMTAAILLIVLRT